MIKTLRTLVRACDGDNRPDCPIIEELGAGQRPEFICIKGGSLDGALDLGSAVHIWTKRALPGIPIPEQVLQYAGEPE